MRNDIRKFARLNEHQVSQLLEAYLKDSFYFLEHKKVFTFFIEGKGWVEEKEMEIRSEIYFEFLKTLDEVPTSLEGEKQQKWIQQRQGCIHNLSNLNSVKNIFQLLRNKKEYRMEELFNKEPHLLGVRNGVVDLKKGTLLKPSKDLKVTQMCPYPFNAKAKAPRWERFISEVLPQHQDYIHKLLGYCLTGETNLQKIWLFVGNGRNGKSTFLETVMGVMGLEYSQKTPQNSIISASFTSSASPELTRMKGKRLIVLSETDLDAKLNETNVKQLTGGDTIVARDLYNGYDQFQIVGKFIMATNHLPRITSNDEAIWRRLEVLRFEAQFKHSTDPSLPSALIAEREGILAWLVAGAKKYYGSGKDLQPTSRMLEWNKNYRTEEDLLSGFIDDSLEEVNGSMETAFDIYDNYKNWCKKNAIPVLDQNQFGRNMTKRGFIRKKMGKAHTTKYLNIRLKNVEDRNQGSVKYQTKGKKVSVKQLITNK